jgi:hypothetical protein
MKLLAIDCDTKDLLLIVLRSQLSQWVRMRLAICEGSLYVVNNLPKATRQSQDTRRLHALNAGSEGIQ